MSFLFMEIYILNRCLIQKIPWKILEMSVLTKAKESQVMLEIKQLQIIFYKCLTLYNKGTLIFQIEVSRVLYVID